MGYEYNSTTNLFKNHPFLISDLPQIVWHITNKCLLDCKFCFDEKLPVSFKEEFSIQSIYKILSLLKKLGVQKIDISGGEPLLCDYLQEIVYACVDNGIKITITSSGSGKVNNIEWLVNNWKVFTRIILSLDGTEDIHNILRSNSSAFKNFQSLYLRLFEKKCDIIRINSVITNLITSETKSELLIKCIKELNPLEWCIIQPHPLNKKAEYDSLNIDDITFKKFIMRSDKALSFTNIKTIFRNNNHYSTYWILYSTGILKRASHSEKHTSEIELLTLDFETIKEIINQYEIILPEENYE